MMSGKQKISANIIDLARNTYSIPAKPQSRPNCIIKSTHLLARFAFEKKYPNMNFDYDMDTKKIYGTGYEEYKKFKYALIIKFATSLMEFKEKISSRSDPFDEYLKKEIDDTIKMLKEKNDKKILSHPDIEVHKTIKNILSGRKETPQNSPSHTETQPLTENEKHPQL